MKYLKTYESTDNIYLVADFTKFIAEHGLSERTTKYVFKTKKDDFTKDSLIYDNFYYYEDDNIELGLITSNKANKYDTYKDIFTVLYQTNSLEDALDTLIMSIKSKNYNL